MKIKLEKLVIAQPSLKKLFAIESFPMAFKWQLMKLKKAVDAEFQLYEDQRITLIRKYGTPEEGGKTISVSPENVEEFIPKMRDLLDVEVDIVATKIPLEKLNDTKLTTEDMAFLEPFISDIQSA